VGALERDALEVLSLVRSIKNTFAPINRIPEDVLYLIPDYCNTGKELVALTHVCRGWRERFISRSSLWTYLDCTSVERTRVYLDRSKASALEIRLGEEDCTPFLNDAFLLTVPHLGRLKSLTLSGSSDNLIDLLPYFDSPTPLLKKINLISARNVVITIEYKIFNENLSSLRELRLAGVLPNLAWGNISNLKTFDLRRVLGNKVSVTQLLDFFERAPHLRKIRLEHSSPNSSDAPTGRVVSLPHLKFLTIVAQSAHPILLNHLSIPAGAALNQEFCFDGDESPKPSKTSKTFPTLLQSTSPSI